MTERLTSHRWLGQCIDAHQGFLPLETFMELALFDPHFGYYTKQIRGVGPNGDFSTSASLSRLLGRAVAQWALNEHRKFHGGRFRWNLIEIGGGTGALAHSILTNLPLLSRLGCRFHIVEISPRLQQMQKKTLARHSVIWHTTMSNALESCQGEATIISNELLDTFPCMQFIFHENRWKVVGLTRDSEGIISESFRDIQKQREKAAFDLIAISPDTEKSGRRHEIQWSIRDWIQGWVP
ncbi:MAG: SAM-dependent methyltransferase, partial [Verrucomicrobiota bacterium]